jgi:hypothetical protein
MKWLSAITNIVAAAMLCGTACFIYQDFKAEFDKCEQEKLDAIKSETAAVQAQSDSFATLSLLANDELQRRKSQGKIQPFKNDRVADDLDEIVAELEIANQTAKILALRDAVH